MVFSRREPIQKVLNACGGKLPVKKKAKGAALLEGEEVCSRVSNHQGAVCACFLGWGWLTQTGRIHLPREIMVDV